MIVYVLLSDVDGTLHSVPEPIGYAVTDEEVARAWVARADTSWRRGYTSVKVRDTLPEGYE